MFGAYEFVGYLEDKIMSSYYQLLSSIQRVGFDDAADAAAKAADKVAADAAAAAAGKTYTEEEFNTHQAGLRRKYESRETELKNTQRQLADQLAQAKLSKGLSDEERQDYDTRIEQLEGNFLTEKEKLERRTSNQKDQFETQIAELTVARDKATSDYQNEIVRNQIFSAQATEKGVDPDQFDAILARMIKWEEVLVDGEPNGQVTPIVNFNDIDKDDKPVVMKYSILEAVKRMKELPKYQNLFEDNLKGGLGGRGNVGKGTPIDVVKLAKENPAEYRRLRKEQPELIYGSK